jgi:syntaxin-binding protein 1
MCITLGEYPKIRYWQPREPSWDAAVLCSHLANFVQQELDTYAHWNNNFPPPSQRPQATLLITDRAMDLTAPFVHEFTYQAMAHDLLPIQDGDKLTYHTVINQGTPEAEEKDMELSEKDKIWVENRHRHMKDTIDKLMGDFRKFIEQNPHFTNENADTTNLGAIRDMLAGLPQFQEMKEAYSLHLTMAQECMNIFQHQKLPDIASSEQTLATGLDEDYRKPKEVLESVVRLLDDEVVTPADRLRLIVLYVLYRDGVVLEDVKRLLAHASLPQPDADVLTSLESLGGRTIRRELKEVRPPKHQLFPIDPRTVQANEEYSLSRFEPTVKPMLDALSKGTLDQIDFPYVKPPMDPNEDLLIAQGGSLRAGRPNWAAAGRRPPENRQRIIVFMAGGATYSESRACYEVSAERGKDIILATSHMLTPSLYIRQLKDLCRSRKQLDLPADRPKPRAPAHLFERPAPPPSASPPARGGPGVPTPPPSSASNRRPVPQSGGLPSRPGGGGSPAPPTQAMGNMSLNSGSRPPTSSQTASNGSAPHHESGKLHKEKKKRNFLGMKK